MFTRAKVKGLLILLATMAGLALTVAGMKGQVSEPAARPVELLSDGALAQISGGEPAPMPWCVAWGDCIGSSVPCPTDTTGKNLFQDCGGTVFYGNLKHCDATPVDEDYCGENPVLATDRFCYGDSRCYVRNIDGSPACIVTTYATRITHSDSVTDHCH